MIVLSFDQPHATLIVNGEQNVATYPKDLRLTEPLLTPLVVGQMVAIARPCPGCNGEGWHWDECQVCHGKGSVIVGSARVEACVPIVDQSDLPKQFGPCVSMVSGRLHCWLEPGLDDFPHDITDQLPFADFTPGRWALILTDAARCEKRCPACDWHDYHPDIHRADGNCDPIPYTQDGPIGEWTP